MLRHENGVDEVEIIGIGEDPHRPAEIIKNAKRIIAKKALEEIEELRNERELSILISACSYDDMYAYEYWAGRVADADKSWKLETNLPKWEIPEYDEEGRVIII